VRLLGCCPETIKRGVQDLKSPTIISEDRIKAIGAGRKKCLETIEGINEAFLRVIDRHVAGSPMNESERWTHLTRPQIADLLKEEEAIALVPTYLKKHCANYLKNEESKSELLIILLILPNITRLNIAYFLISPVLVQELFLIVMKRLKI
jgi:hypothetical protein